MRKLASAIRKLKGTPRYYSSAFSDRRREVAGIAESILLKMEICDSVIAKSIGLEFADYGYCGVKASDRWDWLYNTAQRTMREQWK